MVFKQKKFTAIQYLRTSCCSHGIYHRRKS